MYLAGTYREVIFRIFLEAHKNMYKCLKRFYKIIFLYKPSAVLYNVQNAHVQIPLLSLLLLFNVKTAYVSNRRLGNNRSIKIEFGNESSIVDYWIDGLPLKVITHGWLASQINFTGVFCIKTGI